MTFAVHASVLRFIEYDWQRNYELFCVCNDCHRPTTFKVEQREYDDQKVLNAMKPEDLVAVGDYFRTTGYVSLKDMAARDAPADLPPSISMAFKEGAICLAVECPNAAGTMFRLCIDFATKEILEKVPETLHPGKRIRYNLGLRLAWLLDNGHLDEELRELSHCIREDGNDGAHAGTLSTGDAEDLADFTYELLDALYAKPKRLADAKVRRDLRRGTAS